MFVRLKRLFAWFFRPNEVVNNQSLFRPIVTNLNACTGKWEIGATFSWMKQNPWFHDAINTKIQLRVAPQTYARLVKSIKNVFSMIMVCLSVARRLVISTEFRSRLYHTHFSHTHTHTFRLYNFKFAVDRKYSPSFNRLSKFNSVMKRRNNEREQCKRLLIRQKRRRKRSEMSHLSIPNWFALVVVETDDKKKQKWNHFCCHRKWISRHSLKVRRNHLPWEKSVSKFVSLLWFDVIRSENNAHLSH